MFQTITRNMYILIGTGMKRHVFLVQIKITPIMSFIIYFISVKITEIFTNLTLWPQSRGQRGFGGQSVKDTPYCLEKWHSHSWKRRVVPADKWPMWHFYGLVWHQMSQLFGGGHTHFSSESGLNGAARSGILEFLLWDPSHFRNSISTAISKRK